MSLARRLAGWTLALAALQGCGPRESPEAAHSRSRAASLRAQIEGLEATIAKAERGELVTADRIAIGVAEELVKNLLNASLPLETVVAGRLRVSVESAQPSFRGTQAALQLRAVVSSVGLEGATASLDIAGSLDRFELEGGRLRARVALGYFAVRESGAGELAAGAVESVIRANLASIEAAIPDLELPVQLEESIAFAGLAEGPVVAKPGALPLQIGVGLVLVADGRLWVLLDAAAGRWQPADDPAAAAESG